MFRWRRRNQSQGGLDLEGAARALEEQQESEGGVVVGTGPGKDGTAPAVTGGRREPSLGPRTWRSARMMRDRFGRAHEGTAMRTVPASKRRRCVGWVGRSTRSPRTLAWTSTRPPAPCGGSRANCDVGVSRGRSVQEYPARDPSASSRPREGGPAPLRRCRCSSPAAERAPGRPEPIALDGPKRGGGCAGRRPTGCEP